MSTQERAFGVQQPDPNLGGMGGVPTTRTITGGGLATGGGDLSANRVITVTPGLQADITELADSGQDAGATGKASDAGHQHGHGNRAGGPLHAVVTTNANGFMSSGDKLAFDGLMALGPNAFITTEKALLQSGTGSPEGVITAVIGAIYRDTNGEGTWYKRSGTGNTGWFPLALVGTGTPEGAITAPIGSTFHRTDGGAGSSFYVKESGTGNTGWVAK